MDFNYSELTIVNTAHWCLGFTIALENMRWAITKAIWVQPGLKQKVNCSWISLSWILMEKQNWYQKTEEEENKGPSCEKTGKKNKKRESQYYIPTGHLLVILEKILGNLFKEWFVTTQKRKWPSWHTVWIQYGQDNPHFLLCQG